MTVSDQSNLPESVRRAIAGEPWAAIVAAAYPTDAQEQAIRDAQEAEGEVQRLNERHDLERLCQSVLRGEHGAAAKAAAETRLKDHGHNLGSLQVIARVVREARQERKR